LPKVVIVECKYVTFNMIHTMSSQFTGETGTYTLVCRIHFNRTTKFSSSQND